jgi:hypothetical protein
MSTIKAVVILSLLAASAVAQDSRHKFFDKTNIALFAAHAATTAWDAYVTEHGTTPHFVTTRGCVQVRSIVPNACKFTYGDSEGNPLARPLVNRGIPGVVTYFSLEVACNVAGAYLLHRTGHHKLERALSVVDIGFSAHSASTWIGVR